jgi:cobalt/nickel transport protein
MNRTALPRAAAALTAALTFSGAAQAHFQLLYTPEMLLETPAEIDLALIFGHPMENTHTMDMGPPEAFFVLFRGEKTDLTDSLEAVDWQGPGEGSAQAYKASYSIRRNGDYLFALVPEPYMEASEDIYIQQLTKTIVNKGAMPTGWNEPIGAPMGLPTEIVPLNKPYQVFAGSTFTGQLLAEGEPAAGVECEIEYINSTLDLQANRTSQETLGPVPKTGLVTITDANGVFTFGIPRPGIWGFACLGSGPDKEHKGKELSQDAVLWINVTAFE